jgi:hypothetical protein
MANVGAILVTLFSDLPGDGRWPASNQVENMRGCFKCACSVSMLAVIALLQIPLNIAKCADHVHITYRCSSTIIKMLWYEDACLLYVVLLENGRRLKGIDVVSVGQPG